MTTTQVAWRPRSFHACLLLVFVVPLSHPALALALGGYGLRMWAITAGYRRYFAHRSYRTSRGFQLVLALFGATSMATARERTGISGLDDILCGGLPKNACTSSRASPASARRRWRCSS